MSPLYRLLFWGFLLGTTSLSAQPFYGYQTNGVHTWFFSLNWNGEAPELGIGYGLRRPWSGFADITAEWRAPLGNLFQGDQQTFVVGAYGPFRLRSRPYIGGGVHLRWQHYRQGDAARRRLTLATTLIPSYTFAAPLNDQPYLTGGLRATGLVVLADMAAGAGDTRWFSAVGTEVGTQLSLHLERTLGVGQNLFAQRLWALDGGALPDQDADWDLRGDLYLGSTYHLRRW
ncbi:MAG: hypothetical protein D6722_13530 [Bacteroidetes bacterium]|nr:MAG: hypothetical protein D6722_13530 [Bacteroidota bacterium]